MAEVLLIQPSVSYDEKANRSNIRPPLGILNLAAPLVEMGYKVRILDQRVVDDWKRELLQELRKGPICAGISCMSGNQIRFALELSRFIKKHSEIPVVWGGVHPTLEPVSTISCEDIDIAVIGEGDYVFPDIVRALDDREDLSKIRGIAYKTHGKIRKTGPSPKIVLDNLPRLPFELIDFQDYRQKNTFFGFESDMIAPLETSRGCSHRCSFCFQSKQPTGWRGQSVGRMIEDIRNVVDRYKINSFTFNDDNFFVDMKRIEDFSSKLKLERLDIEWYTSIRPEVVSRINFFNDLKNIGLKSLTIGIESGSEKILKMIRKGAGVPDFLQANRILKKEGILPLYCAIQGFPYENLEDIKKTYGLVVKLIRENRKCRVSLLKLIPTPSTEILNMCVSKGFNKPETLEEWSKVIDTHYKKSAPWVDDEVEEWINRSRFFNKFLAMRNEGTLLSGIAYSISAALLKQGIG